MVILLLDRVWESLSGKDPVPSLSMLDILALHVNLLVLL